MAKEKKYKQNILVEFRNAGSFLYEIESTKPLEVDEVVEWFEKNKQWSELTDTISWVNAPIKIKIDE